MADGDPSVECTKVNIFNSFYLEGLAFYPALDLAICLYASISASHTACMSICLSIYLILFCLYFPVSILSLFTKMVFHPLILITPANFPPSRTSKYTDFFSQVMSEI